MEVLQKQVIWDRDIAYLKHVGPKRAEALKKHANIFTFRDLLIFFPRKYVDRGNIKKISEIEGTEVHLTLLGCISHIQHTESKKGRGILSATFEDGTGKVELIWFQGISWIQAKLSVGMEIAVFGKPTFYQQKIQITHPEIDYLKDEAGPRKTQAIVPFYSSTEALNRMGLDSAGIRKLVFELLGEHAAEIEENLSLELIQSYGLPSHQQAIRHIHFPETWAQLQAATQRLKFEELFYFQLMLARKRSHTRLAYRSEPFVKIGAYFNGFYENHLPFSLTEAQKRVLREIRKDLSRPIQMNRLIQGDVGSGKTMVAFMSILIAIDNDFQAVLMAPTAILAEQHYRKIQAMAQPLSLRADLLVGGQRKAERDEILENIASGASHIIIGTHALLEDGVRFKKLGLVVVDEQHKFGVMQRAKLWSKSEPFPHNMVMTATPIPRTLAMTLYGDIDVSIIDQLPPGRKPIVTKAFTEKKRLEVLGFIKREIQKGRQAYVVYPLVEESEKLDLLAAEQGFDILGNYFHEYRVGIVHGKMKPENKELEMRRFVQNETQILVSTTVIEVGVDVPNATIILIENAERFGLSQLHQLRGRVGRGGEQSYCILMAGLKVSNEGKQRLKAMVETQDGFKISEIDLQLRGPGDFLGTRQSGIPEFQLANLVQDQDILNQAREAAFHINEMDPQLNLPDHINIRSTYKKYAQRYAHLGSIA